MAVRKNTHAIPAKQGHKTKGEVRRSRRTRWRAFALVLVHALVAVHIAHWYATGESISPLEPSEAYETIAYGAVNAGFILLVLLILSTLIFGRFFCGWACHLVAYQDFCASLLARFGIRPKPVRSRLLVFVPALAAIDIFILPALQNWLGEGGPSWSLTWNTSTESLWETFPTWSVAIVTLLVDGFLVVWFFGSKGFCSYGCPYGAVFGLAEKVAPGRIRVTDACEGCGHCTAICTSNVEVHREVALFGMVVDSNCLRCLDCVSVCPKDALFFGFRPAVEKSAPTPSREALRVYDFTWGEELLMAVIFAGSLYGFRNLYGAVPFLLAIGMATIAGLLAVVTLRLAQRQDLVFQHANLCVNRKFTRTGFVAVILAPLYLAFAGHSGFIQYHQREGVTWNEAAAKEQPASAAANAAVAKAIQHLTVVADWSLVDTAEVHNRLGQLLAHSAQRDKATTHFLRALEIDPKNVSAHVALAEVRILENKNRDAMVGLIDALGIRPDEARAANALLSLLMREASLRPEAIAQLESMNARFAVEQPTPNQEANQLEASLRLAEAMVTDLQVDAAIPLLDAVLSAHPHHPAALRCLTFVLQRAPSNQAARELADRIKIILNAAESI